MRALALLAIAWMDNLSLVVVGAVPLLLADERLVDLELQVRLARGIVGLHVVDSASQSVSVPICVLHTVSTHLFRILLNRNSRPSLVSSRKLLSSRENEMRGSLSNSATSVGKSIFTKTAVGKLIQRWIR